MNKKLYFIGSILGLFLLACQVYAVSPTRQELGGTATSTVFTANQFIYQGTNSYAGATIGPGLSFTGGVLSASGNTNYWTTTTNGIYLNSGYLVGINSTTPTANLTIQGSSTAPTLTILNVASSSNASYLTVGANGSTTLSSLSAGSVFSTAAGALYVDGITGSGLSVLQTSPTLITPILGVASGTALSLSNNLWVTGAASTSGQTTLTTASSTAFSDSGPLFVTGQSTLTTASATALSISGNVNLNTSSGSTTINSLSAGNLCVTSSGSLYISNCGLLTSVSLIAGATISGSSFTLATSSNSSTWQITAAGSTLTFNLPNNLVTSVTGSGSITSTGGTTPVIALQNLTSSDVLFGQGNTTIATSSTFTYSSTNNNLFVTNSSSTVSTIGTLFVTGQSTLAAASSTSFSSSGNIYDKNNNLLLSGWPTRFGNISSTSPSAYDQNSYGSASTTFEISPFQIATTMKYMYCKTHVGTVNIHWGNGTTFSNFQATTSGASTTPAIIFNAEQSQLLTASSSTSGADGLLCTATNYPN